MKAIWFTTTKGLIGIVVIRDEITKENKAYIGIGNGENEIQDMETISQWGAKFPLSEALRLIN